MKAILEKKIFNVLKRLQDTGRLPVLDIHSVHIERPKDEQFGEYTSNIALVLAKEAKQNPLALAEAIRELLASDDFEKIEVARPGHLNFYLSQKVLADVLSDAITKGKSFGDAEIGKGIRIDNEIISANPTGPLHLGNARGGFYGDVISRVLRKVGYDVTNEYYTNDAGEQVMKLGHSVLKDEESAYAGEYIDELHERLAHDVRSAMNKDGVREIGEKAAAIVLEEIIKPTVVKAMGISIDLWVSEKRDIVEAGLVDQALEVFKKKKLSYESEGALWLRTTDFGDDKDRVLVKSDGTRTYFAHDCGYILHKKSRNFSRLILILGADHHGYRARLQAAAEALGFDGVYDISFVQLVRLVKDGVEVRMSKRAGNVVTVDELLGRIPVDVARFFFLLYSPDTQMNFDLGLAEERSAKNPVYYVQYAHARLSSILRKAEEAGFSLGSADLSLLVHLKERGLLREILFFPELVEDIAASSAVHKLPQYAIRLADKLHSFYDECRVIDEGNAELTRARLALVSGIKTVFSEALRLMGVTAPEKM